MSTSVITITIKPQLYTKITLMIGRIRDGLIPISDYSITINTLSNIEKVRVADLFRPTFTYCTITPNISSLGGRVDDLVPISNSPITTNSLSCIVRVKVDGLFRPRGRVYQDLKIPISLCTANFSSDPTKWKEDGRLLRLNFFYKTSNIRR